MPSPKKSTPGAKSATITTREVALAAMKMVKEKRAVALKEKSAAPAPSESMPATFTEEEARRIAERLIPDLSPGQWGELAEGKARIGRLVASLLAAQAEARSIMHSLRPAEPKSVDCPTAAVLAELEAGALCLDLRNSREPKSHAICTQPGDDLGTEVFWAVDTEDQLAEMIERLTPLATRDEYRALLSRRALVAEYLCPSGHGFHPRPNG